MELRDLVKFASVKSLRPFAVAAFRRRYKKPKLHISNDEQNVFVFRRIFLSDLDLALSMLQHFGSEILDLTITFDENRNGQLQQIMSHASEYCENLTKLNVRTIVEDALIDIKSSFKNVVEVQFEGKLDKIGNDVLSSAEMFPKVQKLHLNDFELIDGANAHLPHLKLVYIKFSNEYTPTTDETIETLIAANPQIHGLHLDGTKTSLVQFVSENLPNLELLHMKNFLADYMYDIHFKSVKTFKIGKLIAGQLGQITFDRLEEFKCSPDDFPCIPFLRSINVTNLKKLSFFTDLFSNLVSSDDLTGIMQTTPNLTEAEFNCGPNVAVDTIIQFLGECTQLEKLELYIGNSFLEKRIDELQARIANETMAREWILEKTFSLGLVISRKLSTAPLISF